MVLNFCFLFVLPFRYFYYKFPPGQCLGFLLAWDKISVLLSLSEGSLLILILLYSKAVFVIVTQQ